MNFGLMYVPDGVRCTKEVYRVLKPEGRAVLTTWNHAGVPKLVADATAAVGAPHFFSPTDNGWDAKEKLVSTVQAGGFKIDDIRVTMEKTTLEQGSADGIVEALSSSFWNPLHDGTLEATSKWQKALRAIDSATEGHWHDCLGLCCKEEPIAFRGHAQCARNLSTWSERVVVRGLSTLCNPFLVI